MAGNPSPYVKSFSCPNCGGPQQIRALGQSVTYACSQCGALIDINAEPFRIIGESVKAPRPAIPLGTRGTFRGELYEIIGFMVRVDRTGAYEWREYLLFNPYKGYRWLTEMNGHWNFVVPVKADPEACLGGVRFEGRRYQRFTLDVPSVKAVMGEFYWRVRAGDRVIARDYVSPPYMLSEEEDETERNYSLAEYLPSAELHQSLDPKAELRLPRTLGTSPNKPGPFQEYAWFLYSITLAFALMFLVIQLIFVGAAGNRLVLTQYFEPIAGPQMTSPFEIAGDGNLGVTVNSAVSNSWVSVEYTLINADTQQNYEGQLEVAYYAGADSEGPWTEGSQTSFATMGPVLPGRYQLRVEPTFDPVAQRRPFTVIIRRNVPYWGNFWFALLMLSLPAIIIFIARLSSESKRRELQDWDETAVRTSREYS